MTRVTPLPREIAKLVTRPMGSLVAAPRSSQLLAHTSKTAASRARKEIEHGVAEVPASERSMTTTHRPNATPAPLPKPSRTIPLMQSFHTTQAPSARADTSTIDYAFLPALTDPAPPAEYVGRVPLLPDNFAPERAADMFAPEAADEPLPASEIVVMAADPASVAAVSALTEIDGMGPDGVELRFDFGGRDSGGEAEGEYAGGMLKDLWTGIVDDVIGGQKRPAF